MSDTHALAYVNAGRWIADCTREHCANAEPLEPRQTMLHCSNCKALVQVRWPAGADEIWQVLKARPVPQTRNWAPAGHRQAIACHFPQGQSVAELLAENREHGVI